VDMRFTPAAKRDWLRAITLRRSVLLVN